MKRKPKAKDFVTVSDTEWPRCECSKRATVLLGRERLPLCNEGLTLLREHGDRRVVKKLRLPKD